MRPGELTATVLDSPEEEESSSSGWTSTVITTDGSPEDGGASQVQDPAEGAEVMQELVTQLEGLVEGASDELLQCVARLHDRSASATYPFTGHGCSS